MIIAPDGAEIVTPRHVKGKSYFVSSKHKCQLYESRSLPTATATKNHVRTFASQFPMKLPVSVIHGEDWPLRGCSGGFRVFFVSVLT